MATSNANPLETSRARLAEVQHDLTDRLDALRRTAVRKAQLVAGESRARGLGAVYAATATALDAAATAAKTLPGASGFAQTLETRAQEATARGAELTQPPIANYDELNVKEVCAQLDELDAWQLTQVKRYEEAHKQRKTVLGAVGRLLD